MWGKKIPALPFFFLTLTLAAILQLYAPKPAYGGREVIIPEDAIRLRILANSNSEEDQRIKRKIRDEVNAEIARWTNHLTSREEARKVIAEKLPEIRAIARRVLKKENPSQDVQVVLDKVYFPTKLYGNFLYPAGRYEAVLITIGEGKGANWWCVLFPPLCFLDFSSGAAVKKPDEKTGVKDGGREESRGEKAEEAGRKEDEVEVKFFVVELFENIRDFFKD